LEKLVNKNAIKIINPKMVYPLSDFDQKALTPQKIELPPPLDFQPCAS
jgi:hypothetical protein